MRACSREISASWPSVPSSDACRPIRNSSVDLDLAALGVAGGDPQTQPSAAGSPARPQPCVRRGDVRQERRPRGLDELAAARVALLGLLGERLCDHVVDRGGELGAAPP